MIVIKLFFFIDIFRILYAVVFDESVSSELSYTSRSYSEVMAMRPAVTYTPYTTSSREQTDNIITFAQFEEGNILPETRNDTESGEESDSKSIMMSKQDMEISMKNKSLMTTL